MSKLHNIKKKFKSLNINTRFTMVVAGITLIILITNMFLFYNINYIVRRMDAIYDSNIRLNNLSETIDLVRSSMTSYLNTKSSESMENYYKYEQNLQNQLDGLNDRVISDKLKIAEKNIRNMTYTYLEYTDEAIEAKRGRNVEKYKIYYNDAEIIYGYVNTYINNLNNELFKENAESYELISGSFKFLETLCIVIFGIVAVTGIILVSIICNNITTPLRYLATAAEQVSVGNYDVELNSNESNDEIGVVTNAFNSMVDSVQENIEKLRQNMELEQKMKEKELLMEAHLKEAQLKYLQAQINPHFLFNTLNAGAQLAMMEGADRAYEYIQQVATFFRYNIKKDNDVVTLREEISMVDVYLYILNVRFSGEIGYDKVLDESLLDAKIPSMCIQPLVENSINYGIRDIDWKGVVTLAVYREDKNICISVKDNGIGMSKERIEEVLSNKVSTDSGLNDSNGIGLNNVISRIELLYNTENVIKIMSEGKNKGTEVILYIPYSEM